MDGIVFRPIVADELEDFLRTVEGWFLTAATEEALARVRPLVELERTLVAFDGERIVATAAALSTAVTLPGGRTAPMAGVTSVGVRPTHRRRGLLRALMAEQLDDVARRGEPLAGLLASEAPIYGRHGYGVATQTLVLDIDTRRFALTPEAEEVVAGHTFAEIDDVDRAVEVLPPLDEACRRARHGEVAMVGGLWAVQRADRGHRIDIVCHRDGNDVGYATVSASVDWSGTAPDASARAFVHGVDDRARLALVRFLASLDLVRTVRIGLAPDDPLPWALVDRRALRLVRLEDHLWLRIVDLPAALGLRTSKGGGEVVLEVTDPVLEGNNGCWTLRADPGGPMVVDRCDGPGGARVRTDVSTLSSMLCGGLSASTAAGAGRLGSPDGGAVAALDRLMATPSEPFCSVSF